MKNISFVVLMFLRILTCGSGANLSTTEETMTSVNYNNLFDDGNGTSFQDLFESILKKYNKHLPPPTGFLGYILQDTSINSTLLSLIELDDVEERLSTVIMFTMRWNDVRLQWNDTNYGIIVVPLDDKMVWKPPMVIGNSHAGKRQRTDYENLVYILPSGDVWWEVVKIIDSRCDVDTTHFPFDKQFCHIDFTFPSTVTGTVDFKHEVSDSAQENGNWRLSGHEIKKSYSSLGARILIIEYEFNRKPTSAVITLIIPVFILVSLVPLVFTLPREGGDRLGLTITVLLAVSVYMTLVADNLPSASDPMPLITIVLFTWYLSNALILLIVLINGKIYRLSESRPLSPRTRRFVEFTNRIFGKRDIESERKTSEDPDLADGQPLTERHAIKKITWKHVSSSIDRWAFAVIYAMKITFAISIFFILFYGDKDKVSGLDVDNILD